MNFPNQHKWQQITPLMQTCNCGAYFGYVTTAKGKKQIAARLWDKCTKAGN